MDLQLNNIDNINQFCSEQIDPKARTWVEIDKQAILHNLAQFKSVVGPNVQLSIVAKSNAYGHGLAQISQVIQESNAADWLCIFALSEGIVARQNGFKKPILVLGYADLELELAIMHEIDLVVYDLELPALLNEKAKKLKKTGICPC